MATGEFSSHFTNDFSCFLPFSCPFFHRERNKFPSCSQMNSLYMKIQRPNSSLHQFSFFHLLPENRNCNGKMTSRSVKDRIFPSRTFFLLYYWYDNRALSTLVLLRPEMVQRRATRWTLNDKSRSTSVSSLLCS